MSYRAWGQALRNGQVLRVALYGRNKSAEIIRARGDREAPRKRKEKGLPTQISLGLVILIKKLIVMVERTGKRPRSSALNVKRWHYAREYTQQTKELYFHSYALHNVFL